MPANVEEQKKPGWANSLIALQKDLQTKAGKLKSPKKKKKPPTT